jgi:hypothetical protein
MGAPVAVRSAAKPAGAQVNDQCAEIMLLRSCNRPIDPSRSGCRAGRRQVPATRKETLRLPAAFRQASAAAVAALASAAICTGGAAAATVKENFDMKCAGAQTDACFPMEMSSDRQQLARFLALVLGMRAARLPSTHATL